MTISQYLEQIQKLHKSGLSSEHSYRGDLRTLIESLVPEVMVTNEPKRIACGAPDYIITRKEIPVGYIEAKDLGKDIGHKDYKEQFDRYKKSLNNLIITDYIDFWLFIDGELKTKLKIAEIVDRKIVSIPENYDQFNALIRSFCTHAGQTIKSASKLSVMMADKAKLLAIVIESALNSDVENEENSTLKDQMHAFKDILIHDITPREFADIYAQTIAYGMFAARIHDTTLNTFSRQEAAELIPKTNPFLRKLFQYVAGVDLDSRIVWIVDALADIFRATDVAALLQNFGKSTQMNDPIIHFYETFLAEYDPSLRKTRGVWYTPEPVVNFIVRAVDDILRTEFNLPQGLADSSKIKIKRKAFTQATTDRRSVVKEVETEVEVHKVQILDPATGTGTFLAEVVKQVYGKFKGQQGIWSSYVEKHLIPRINGFELLMASYAIAHLKLDMLLTETGFKATTNQRFRIYLTNSLEEHHADTGTLFANWLSSEANEANHIKRDTPVMVVMGNPPYSISSINKSIDGDGNKTWIGKLIDDYKKDLNEKKINLDDDYIKFIRFGEHFVEKNGEGILAYISNNSFVDGVTHRQMRKHLLATFDKLYILDLHGFGKLKETSLVANDDENIFKIIQGVSINIFVKYRDNKFNEKQIKYFEKYGTRIEKFNFLRHHNLSNISWTDIHPNDPYYFFVKKNFSEEFSYNNGFVINELFAASNSGIKTDRDELFYDDEKQKIEERFHTLLTDKLENSFASKYRVQDSGSYKITTAILNKRFNSKHLQKCLYRPFEYKWTYYDPKIISRPAQKAMSHFNNLKNIGLVIGRQGQVVGHMQWNLVFCTNSLTDYNVFYRGGGYVFPLYQYRNFNGQESLDSEIQRVSNFNSSILSKISACLKLEFFTEKKIDNNTFSAVDVFNYIYAILHSSTYREKYKEFLKIDFPRIPYPKDAETFWEFVKLGERLKDVHLLEHNSFDKYITSYPQDGDNTVSVIKFEGGQVYINETQYFGGVPETAWRFYIGGYQPAQKWLKDRKGSKLNFDDILHYQKIIVALFKTDEIMSEIDNIDFQ